MEVSFAAADPETTLSYGTSQAAFRDALGVQQVEILQIVRRARDDPEIRTQTLQGTLVHNQVGTENAEAIFMTPIRGTDDLIIRSRTCINILSIAGQSST